MTIDDKEVGKLWRERASHSYVSLLIEKLVEERAVQYCDLGRTCAEYESLHVRHALRDFGIDPKDWEIEP